MTQDEVARHIDTANATWTARSALAWTLDLSMLTDAGVTLAPPSAPVEGRTTAERQLGSAGR